MTTDNELAKKPSSSIPTLMLGLGVLAMVCVGLKHGFIELAFLVPRDALLVVWVLAVVFLFVEWSAVIGIALMQVVLTVITLVRNGTSGAIPALFGWELTALAVVLLAFYGRDFQAGPLLFDSGYTRE